MSKVLSILTLAFALSLAASPLLPAGSAHAAAALKTCKSKLPSGKLKTWKCKADVPCCVNQTMGLYVCGQPVIGCF